MKEIQRVLHTSLHGGAPRRTHISYQLHMMFKVEVVHQSVESSIIEKLVSQRNFNAAIVHIKLDDYHIILIVVRQ